MRRLLVGFALPLLLGIAPVERSPLYRVENLAPHAAVGEAYAVNVRGDVAGQVDGHAFVWRSGQLETFPALVISGFDGPYTSEARAINASDVAAGSDGNYQPCSMSGLELATAVWFKDGKTLTLEKSANVGDCSYEVDGINDAGTMVGIAGYRGFVRTADGHEVEVQPLSNREEYNGTHASAIDNEGHVVGGTTINQKETDPEKFVVHAFLATFYGGVQKMRDLGALFGYPDTYATAINEDLTVVGYSGTEGGAKWARVSGPSHAWVWQRGRMTDLGSSKGGDSYANGVNDASVIVGCDGKDAVRWVDKHMENLNDQIVPHSGWHLTCANAINRDGIIVGTGSYEGRNLPFRLVPLPIPPT